MEKKHNKLSMKRPSGSRMPIVQTKMVKNSRLVNDMVNQPPSQTDPMGMYTGNPMNEMEVPVQDADDL